MGFLKLKELKKQVSEQREQLKKLTDKVNDLVAQIQQLQQQEPDETTNKDIFQQYYYGENDEYNFSSSRKRG